MRTLRRVVERVAEFAAIDAAGRTDIRVLAAELIDPEIKGLLRRTGRFERPEIENEAAASCSLAVVLAPAVTLRLS